MVQVRALFDLRYGHSLELNRLEQVEAPHGVNLVSRTEKNNGVSARVDIPHGYVAGIPGEITVALGGSVLATFVQPESFLCGRDVMILAPKNRAMTLVERLWWSRCIAENRYRFSYGRQANRTLSSIELPDKVPDWVINAHEPDFEYARSAIAPELELKSKSEWRNFRILDLFDCERGTPVAKRNRKAGRVPFVTASAQNNSVTDHVDLPPSNEAGQITLPYDGSIGYACFQPEPFYLGEKVNALISKTPISEFASLFVCAVLRHESFRYNYGRKWNGYRLKRDTILLPVTDTCDPDWGYMDNYMRGIPYSGAVHR